ncbi:MAG: hypothetical protein QXN05_02125 [Acidilobaceae archaeon]
MIVVKSRDGFLKVEGFRVRVFEKISLLPVKERLNAIKRAGWNTFLLKADEVF